jgi:quercetin dioxygenase-like cupin family protein
MTFNPVIHTSELPQLVPGRPMLEGSRFGLDHLTIVVGISPPGQQIPLHRHDYEEIFIVHQGTGTYTVGDQTYEVQEGEVVLIPSGIPHAFSNRSEVPLHHTAIHSSGTFELEWLE